MIKIYYISQSKGDADLPEYFHHISADRVINDTPDDADCFVISLSSHDTAYKLISVIRKNPKKSIYLIPVYFITPAEEDSFSNINKSMFDSVFYSHGITKYIADKIYEASAPLIKRIKELPESVDTVISLKIIKFIYIRGRVLTPEMTSENIHGFIYPKIKLFLKKNDYSFFKMLDFLESNNLLRGEFHDIAHFCPTCDSAFLNFREICTNCGSPDLKAEDLIHHFKCANIGPESEYRYNDVLNCPKCNENLKHIGVDFDKPGMVFTCSSCKNIFQEPKTDSKCYNCKSVNPTENLQKRFLKKYILTSLGENAALHGLDSLFRSVIQEDIPIIPYKIFKRILSAESERIKRYSKSFSTIAFFELTQIDKIYTELGANAKTIFTELSNIIKSILRTSDFITSVNESVFITILPETDIKGAYTAIERLKKQVGNLIKNNTNLDISINSKVLPIDGIKSAELILKEILE